MRTKNSIRNIIISFSAYLITILVRFVAQKIFLNILGTEYLGINGLFTNIISMLGIVELGFGTAIVYNLYKPLKENDINLIKALMNFYKKTYIIISIVFLSIALMIIPLLPQLIDKTSVLININVVYVLFIFDIFFSYLFAYKRSVLYADQKNYIVNIFDVISLIILNFFQLLILYKTKDYYLYLVIKIICTIFENILICLYVNKKYKYLSNKNNIKLEKNIEKDIFKKVKALLFHKIGGFIVCGTDNILISKYIGIIYVGLYSNYYLIINSVSNLFNKIISSLTPSIGNLLIEKNTKKNFDIFKKIRFINFWLATFSSISLYVIMQNFIIIWLGNEYLLAKNILLILVINFFFGSMRNPYMTFKEAAGIYYEDRLVPLIESMLNIIFSIFFLKLFGLLGVFIGTFISGMALWMYSYPKYVYKKIFERSYLNYATETILYVIIFVFLLLISSSLSNLFVYDNKLLEFIKNVIISILIPNIGLFLLFFKTEEFNYFINLILKHKQHS